MIKLLRKKRCVAFATALVAAAMMLQGTAWGLTPDERAALIQIRNMLQQANADYKKRKAKYEHVYVTRPGGLTDEQIDEAEVRAHYLQANIFKNEGILETIDAQLQGKEKEQVFSEQRIGQKKWDDAIRSLEHAMGLEKTLRKSPREYPWSKWSANIGVPIGPPMTLETVSYTHLTLPTN